MKPKDEEYLEKNGGGINGFNFEISVTEYGKGHAYRASINPFLSMKVVFKAPLAMLGSSIQLFHTLKFD